MKKTALLLLSVIAMTSCTRTVNLTDKNGGVNKIQEGNISNLKREDIKVLANVEGSKTWVKMGPLFFLFGSKGGNESARREKVYLKVCKENKIDGLLQPKFETKSYTIPLIVFNYVKYKTYVTGKGYVIKAD
ncbi:hypothetical protein [Flectobacillus sp. BAB-3569]|uniref:hypothetical protein n=1 Tax=Flectobacillus sp. BAB-3569 TaxID=1509483 RepID=UPI000BA47A73|nr:hypothetical protein [Flectobacillus sp. BAB-3569]PAC29225.1 hypothetical protein BWI92_16485 [Flectobacillus sp. BAB-3569]